MNAERTAQAQVVAVPRQRQTVLWIIAILLAIIATALVVRSPMPMAAQPAFGDTSVAGARGVFAFTGQLDKNRYGLFMMDVDNGSVWCYEYLPSTRKLKLVAARSFLYDRYLEDYQCDVPKIETVKKLLEEQRRVKDRIGGGVITPRDDEEAGALGTSLPGFP